jgi:hypothetical protein
MRSFPRRIAIVFLICTVGAAPLRAAVVYYMLKSDPGDFIGAGGTYNLTYTPEMPGNFSVSFTPVGGVFMNLGHVTAPNTFTTASFSTQTLGVPLAPGTYLDARRTGFVAGKAGLDVTFQNRGSNELSGSFTINELTYTSDATPKLLTFDVTFEQHSEFRTPALYGNIRFVSSAAIPEPSSVLLAAVGVIGIGGRIFRRRGIAASAF